MTGWVSDTMKRRDLRIISCHLGGSGSLAAVRDGVCIDTTMGMSLQCGILNNNRIGEIDPYVIFYLNEKCGMKIVADAVAKARAGNPFLNPHS